MLKLIIGRAKSGKTARIMDEIQARAGRSESGIKLIVPEQYSHEAERELCRRCGDTMSLHAEVLSFTRLSRRIADMIGGNRRFLSNSGRVLALSRALESVGSRLKVYGAARRATEMQKVLLGAIAELKTSHITPDILSDEAEGGDEALHDKLSDLSLILGAYDAFVSQGELDPGDRLIALAKNLEEHSEIELGAFYIDGFVDFTAAEHEVIYALSRRCSDLTVCLTMDSMYEENEVFESSRRTALWFKELAGRRGEELQIVHYEREGETPVAVLEKYLFGYTSEQFDPEGKIKILKGESMAAECEYAAARAIELVQTGCRWRDIAIAARGFDSYRPALEHAFERYDVPLYVAARSDVMQKPLPLMISSALDAVTGGFEYESMFACLKTGLAGLEAEELDLLENYCITWSVRGKMWNSEWTMHPEGYNRAFNDESTQALKRLNEIRKRTIAPFLRLMQQGASASTVAGQAQALADFFSDIDLPANLERRSNALSLCGEATLAAEYSQLWDVAVEALEQAVLVLPDTEMTLEEFGRLYKLMLSQCDVGSIPVSLDRVSAGEMDRMRRRSIKHLIVLGASDQRLPRVEEPGGIFSPDERRRLYELGLDLGGTAESELSREMNIIYNCLSLPSDTLSVSYCPALPDAEGAQPSFVMTRIEALFGVSMKRIDLSQCRMWSASGAWGLAAEGLHSGSIAAASALEYFNRAGEHDRLELLHEAAQMDRGSLSQGSVRALYGNKLRLSASRVDKFASCRFAFFMQYGLKAKPRQAAGFDPPEMGTFVHYVLERTARCISETASFGSVARQQVDEMCDRFVEEYVHEKLNDFREKTPRFIYLFRRLTKTVRSIVWDMVEELSRSDFEPLDFELSFSGDGVDAVEIDSDAQLVGVADRVDGWVNNGKLYLRVMDYKTGKKSFELSDVLYGRDLQMLMYLFALSERGKARYGMDIIPAGVLYVPARETLVASDGDLNDDELLSAKSKEKRRSGLVLGEAEVLQAMEHGQDTKFLPVSFKKGVPAGDCLASAEQLGCISRFVDDTLKELSKQLRSGSIDADPYYRTQQENACLWCDYYGACYFDENRDKRTYVTKMKNAKVMEKLAEREASNGWT